jgi:hypothetical protein
MRRQQRVRACAGDRDQQNADHTRRNRVFDVHTRPPHLTAKSRVRPAQDAPRSSLNREARLRAEAAPENNGRAGLIPRRDSAER